MKFCGCFMLLTCFVTACVRRPDDRSFIARDEELLQQFDSLQKKWQQKHITQDEFAAGLRELEKQEVTLFQQVRRHHFTNMTAANRFYRWRMKFPSPIGEAQRTLADQNR